MTTSFEVKFENLIFTRNGNNLEISDTTDADFQTVTYEDFFTSTEITQITALDGNGNQQTYTFDDDIFIKATSSGFGYYGTKYNEIITAGENVTLHTGGAGNDTFISTSGTVSQSFQGDAGNDTYYSGNGTDTFMGGTDTDTYIFKANDGNDAIMSYSANDIIKFTDVTWDELTFVNADTNLYITYGNASVTVKGFFDENGNIKEGAPDTIYTSETGEAHSLSAEGDFPTTYFTNKSFSDLSFVKENDNLVVYDVSTEEAKKLTTYVDFFIALTPIETVTALDDNGNYKTYSLLNDVTIQVNLNGQTEKENYYGTDYNENITTDESTQVVWGGNGNDTININEENGKEKICFESGDGDDTIDGATNNNIIYFADGIEYNNMSFDSDGEDLVITYGKGDTVTIKDALDATATLNDNTIQTFYIGDTKYSLANSSYIDNNYDATDFVKGKLTLKEGDDHKIVAENYISTSTKGVTITTGIGNDYIIGSAYNDKITSKGGANTIFEYSGKNTIKTGSDADTIYLESYSSNTVNAGSGQNNIYVDSLGTNKITTGNENDTIVIVNGLNTIKAGSGLNTVTISGGINKVTTGNQTDTFTISGGNNVIKSGKGDDVFTIEATADGGFNTITSGKGTTEFTIAAGINNIKTGKGETTIEITGGFNSINTAASSAEFDIDGGVNIITGGKTVDYYSVESGKAYITDKAGDDEYKLAGITDYEDTFVSINDTKGSNELYLNDDANDLNVFVSVSLGKKAQTDAESNFKYTLGNYVAFTNLTSDGVITSGIEITGRANISVLDFEDGDNEGAHTLYVNDLAQDVANWLGANSYKSTDAVLSSDNSEDIQSLMAVYTNYQLRDCLDAYNA